MNSNSADRRKVMIKQMCEKIGSPSLFWAFNDPVHESISFDVIYDFHEDLIRSLTDNAKGIKTALPINTNHNNLPAFIALEKPKNGAMSLWNLGYRPVWESPIFNSGKYEVKFIIPNGDIKSFITGPDGEYSMYTLWLDMRIISASKDKKPINQSRSPNIQHNQTPNLKNQNSNLDPFFASLLGNLVEKSPTNKKNEINDACVHQ